MRSPAIFQALLLGSTVASRLGSDKFHDEALSFSPTISGSSTNLSISNGTFTFSHNRASSAPTLLQPSSADAVTTSNSDEVATASSQSTTRKIANPTGFVITYNSSTHLQNSTSVPAGFPKIPESQQDVRSSNSTSTMALKNFQNSTSVSAGFPKPSDFQEGVRFPNVTTVKNTSVSDSKPQISGKPTSLTLQNGTYAYAHKNLSIPETKPKGIFRIAAAVAAPKAVFAHFMLGNTVHYTVADWQNDIILARDAHIDGFALNMARGEATNAQSLANAFTAANSLGNAFKLIFSFDYAGRGSFGKDEVIGFINQYKGNPAYFYRGSQPLVSTFEGPNRAEDWPDIKAATGCYFMPSWSSRGAKNAVAAAGGTADGLFSWAGWPSGANDMFTTVDESYYDFLGGKPYMMPVSPWFFTNMPGYRKNWLWRGDDLWFDRWQQVHSLEHQPDYLEIITWNDWGECHYIGPLRPNEFHAFDRGNGNAPFNYAAGYPHDGWREFLPYLIDTYKYGSAPITKEGVSVWYRTTKSAACPYGGTTGNTASQLQFTVSPALVARDKIFFSALLTSSAAVTVSVGGTVITGAAWENTPSGGKGMYHGSVDFGNLVGTVSVTITRGGVTVAAMTNGKPITANCENGIQNWNAWVGSSSSGAISPVTVTPGAACIQGTGPGDYKILCELACKHNYCPPTCTCLARGTAILPPTALGINACPKAGLDITYLGLCSFYCNRKSPCPVDTCTIMPASHVCTAPPAVAPIIPVCNAGNRVDNVFGPLCQFTCSFGFCPPEICDCEQVGTSAPAAPPQTGAEGWSIAGEDYGLCDWACGRGNCPSDVCGSPTNGGGGKHISPRSATVIPFPATTVAATATFTVGGPVVSDIWIQPNTGNQNQPVGPAGCDACDLIRLITSTCCGTGGGVSNPIEIGPGTSLPRDLLLPIGFIPNQDIEGSQGQVWRAGSPVNEEVIILAGTSFNFPFVLPAGSNLSDKYAPEPDEDDTDGNELYITSTFWDGPHTISCSLPCTIVLPPLTSTTTWTPRPYTTINTGVTTTIPIPPMTTEQIGLRKTTVTSSPGSGPTWTFTPIPLPKPLCIEITLPILGTVRIGICPPKLDPFPPTIIIPVVTVVSVPTGGFPGPTPVGNLPTPEQKEQEEEEEEEEEDDDTCEYNGGDYNSDSSGWSFNFPLWLGPGNPMPSGGGSTIGAGTGVPTTKTAVVTVTVSATTRTPVTSTVLVPAPPTQTPSIPSPVPNPNPPTPDRNSQSRTCEAKAPQAYSAPIKTRVENFCNLHGGYNFEPTGLFDRIVWRDVWDDGRWVEQIGIHYMSTGLCQFKFSASECKSIFGQIFDNCKGNTKGFNAAGLVEDNCGWYTITMGNKLNFDGGV